jgi:hypothetical protein
VLFLARDPVGAARQGWTSLRHVSISDLDPKSLLWNLFVLWVALSAMSSAFSAVMNSLRSAAKPRPLSDEELRRRRAAAYDKKQQDLKILGKTN